MQYPNPHSMDINLRLRQVLMKQVNLGSPHSRSRSTRNAPGFLCFWLGSCAACPLVASLQAALDGLCHPGHHHLLVLPHRIQFYLHKSIQLLGRGDTWSRVQDLFDGLLQISGFSIAIHRSHSNRSAVHRHWGEKFAESLIILHRIKVKMPSSARL